MARYRIGVVVVLLALAVGFGALAASVESGYEGSAGGPSTPDNSSGGVDREPLEGAESPGAPLFEDTLGALTRVTLAITVVVGAIVVLGAAGVVLSELWHLIAFLPGIASLFGLDRTHDRVRDDEAVDDESDADLAAVGRAAGAAADRIERDEGDATANEVYRAWSEMVGRLSVPDPEVRSPDEFERRAVAAGMARDDVAELTRLFEEVRYGDRDPSSREERAVAALRRIERQYAAGAAADDSDTAEDDPANAVNVDGESGLAEGERDVAESEMDSDERTTDTDESETAPDSGSAQGVPDSPGGEPADGSGGTGS